jgi:hypothetical protein
MSEWMITIDTAPRVATDEDALLAFAEALDEARGSTGAATSINARTGVLSATFSVEAADVQRGVDEAVTLFTKALGRLGLPPGSVTHVEAESIDKREPVPA